MNADEKKDERVVVGEGAAPSRHANLAFSRVYKTPLHGWCYPPRHGVVSKGRSACVYSETPNVLLSTCEIAIFHQSGEMATRTLVLESIVGYKHENQSREKTGDCEITQL